jgi:uncharacterized protein
VKRLKVIDRANGQLRCQAYDDFTVDQSLRKLTKEGFMVVPGKIARTGIQEYSAHELGIEATNRTVRLCRMPDQVFDPEALASFENQTLTSGHPDRDVNAENYRGVSVGDVHDVKAASDGATVDATLWFKDASAIALVIDGKNQLSCGYSFLLDLTPGTFEGQSYDGRMLEIRGNHVAHVWAARGGPGLRVADNDPNQENAMRVIVIDGISIKVEDDTNASVIEKVVGDAKKAATEANELAAAAAKRATDAEAARDKAIADAKTAADASKKALDDAEAARVKLVADHDAKVKELEAKIPTEAQIEERAQARAKVVADAKVIFPELKDAGKTVSEIRIEALTHIFGADERMKKVGDAILGGAELAKAADRADVAFAAVVAAHGEVTASDKQSDHDKKVADALGGKGSATDGKPETVSGRPSWFQTEAAQ